VAPFIFIGIILIIELVSAIDIYQAVRVIDPVLFRGKVVAGTPQVRVLGMAKYGD
jgi:hypothetical protein